MMKKIITSAAVAAALTTGAFAGSSIFVNKTGTTNNPVGFNTDYTSTRAADVNATDNVAIDTFGLEDGDIVIEYVANVALKENDIITLKLEGGAKFLGAATDWSLNNGTNAMATGANISADGSELKLIVTATGATTLAASKITPMYLNTTTTNTELSVTFGLPSGQSSEVKLSALATNSTGAVTYSDAAVSATKVLVPAETKFKVATASCDTDGSVAVETTERKEFTAATVNGLNKKTVACTLTVSQDTTAPVAVVDYNYETSGLKVAFEEGDFNNDQTFVAAGLTRDTTDEKLFTRTYAAPGTPTNADDFTSSSFPFIYTLKDDADISPLLTSATFKANVRIVDALDPMNGNKVEINKEASTNPLDTFGWKLNSYVAEVLNMRSNADGTVNTYIKVYNNDDKATDVVVTVTDKDGNLKDPVTMATLGANGASMTISATDILAKVPGLVNGYKVQISMLSGSDKGDVTAYQVIRGSVASLRVTDTKDPTTSAGSKGQ
jgi:hypothetical protein